MARLNIEDSLFTDNRFIELVIKSGGLDNALGALIHVWIVGQRYWKQYRKPIPDGAWFEQRLSERVIEVGLAHRREDGVHVEGAENQFEWLAQRVESGQKGGKKSALRPRDAMGRLTKSSKQTPSDDQAPTKQHQASYSYSSSSSKKNTNTSRTGVRGEYDPAFEEVYKTYPRHEGKSGGYKIWLKLSQEERPLVAKAVQNYALRKAGSEAQFLKHFATFMGEWRDWLDPSTGTALSAAPRKLTTADEIAKIGGGHA